MTEIMAKIKEEKSSFFVGVYFILAMLFAFNDSFSRSTLVGKGEGYMGPIQVEVVMKKDQIMRINIIEESDTEGIKEIAFEGVVNGILENQTVKVDSVAGATYSSLGVKNAVHNALSKKNKERFYLTEADITEYLGDEADFYDND